MIRVSFNSNEFLTEMNNVVGYSLGFLDGVNKGKASFLSKLGAGVKEVLKEYIDSNARVNPEMLHHVYEWSNVGSPNARLFDISYRVVGPGISFTTSFRQSSSVKEGSTQPFYDKARIMEEGIPITIIPKRASVLAFEDGGETVFTKGPVQVDNPGGIDTNRGFEKTVDAFFDRYFSQAFLRSSGLLDYLKTPLAYKQDFAKGVKIGRSAGVASGYRWIVRAGEVV